MTEAHGSDFMAVRSGAGYVVSHQLAQVDYRFGKLQETRAGLVVGEITIYSKRPEFSGLLLGPQRIDLTRPASVIRELGVILAKQAGGVDWSTSLLGAVRAAMTEFRAPMQAVDLGSLQYSPEEMTARHLIAPLLPLDLVTIMYADQASGKSFLALLLSLSVATGISLRDGWAPLLKGPVLYLDWELDQRTHWRRTVQISNGWGLSSPALGVHYLRLSGSLLSVYDQIEEVASRIEPVLTVVDSLGWAAGGDLNTTETAVPTMDRIKALPGTKLVTAHFAKQDREKKGRASVHGSGFFEFAAQCLWEIRVDESRREGGIQIGLYNQKASLGSLVPGAIGLRIAFDDFRHAAGLEFPDIRSGSELAVRLKLTSKLRMAIEEHGPLTLSQSSDMVAESEDTVRKAVARNAHLFRFEKRLGVQKIVLAGESVEEVDIEQDMPL